MQLKSRYHEAPDMAAAMELCYAKGWTDGLPVVPPTADRVADMLAAVKLEPHSPPPPAPPLPHARSHPF